ncbi:MAG: pyrroloquinoline quinone biosynthesis protein PqqE [Azospirillaceae bacterium]|nr:pyrroloquinoline quinone biosynthesis protein PqqE [Azospirillaceae bacterium]
MTVPPPLALMMELTHRCPLRCAYCSNPLALEPASQELDTASWRRVLDQAAAMGILQVHFSGGEPTVRSDLEDLVGHAASVGLYTNLITSGVLLDSLRIDALAARGLEHVQLGFQDCDPAGSESISGFRGGFERKIKVAGWLRQRGLALTVNAVMTRHNAVRAGALIDLAAELGARRVEIANVQYYGWGLLNRAALMPTRDQLIEMTAVVEAARQRLTGIMVIDYVIPDYYAKRPKACMGGWARRFVNVTPTGRVLPCHAAETIPDLAFDRVCDRPLAEIWTDNMAFQKYRGIKGMPATCQHCDHREIDWGGCRCQALALAGAADAVDPTCERSPNHDEIQAIAAREAMTGRTDFVYRQRSLG